MTGTPCRLTGIDRQKPYRLALQLPQNIALAARNKPTIAGNNTSYGVGSGIAKAVRKGVNVGWPAPLR